MAANRAAERPVLGRFRRKLLDQPAARQMALIRLALPEHQRVPLVLFHFEDLPYDEIAKKLDEGANFAEMARVYSQGSQRADGGAWGWASLPRSGRWTERRRFF